MTLLSGDLATSAQDEDRMTPQLCFLTHAVRVSSDVKNAAAPQT